MDHPVAISETIRQRTSCRTYRPEPVDARMLLALERFAAGCSEGPLGSKARFQVLAARGDEPQALKGLGTYGFITSAAGFVAGAVLDAPHAPEDFGYLMERIVLYATELGLGTCWLGGSFTRSTFAARLGLRDGEHMPAVVSIGYPAERRSLTDRLIRRTASGDRRLPWEQLFFDGRWSAPLSREAAGPYALALEMVRIGPSASNKQPWRIVRVGEAWHFYLKRTAGYPPGVGKQVLKVADLQRNDLGIAMCHWALSAEADALSGTWLVADPGLEVPEPNVAYTVTWQPR